MGIKLVFGVLADILSLFSVGLLLLSCYGAVFKSGLQITAIVYAVLISLLAVIALHFAGIRFVFFLFKFSHIDVLSLFMQLTHVYLFLCIRFSVFC